jgi:hypothetical protein
LLTADALLGSRRVAASSAVAFAALFVSFAYLEQRLWQSIEVERTLTRSVGEIRRLDEVLTMSARLYASGRDPADRARYDAAAAALDRVIAEASALARDERVHAAFAATEASNRALVAIEASAFARCDAGACAEAAAALADPGYHALKRRYAAGMDTAFGLLASGVAADIGLLRGALLAPLGLAVIAAVVYVLVQRRVAAARRDEERRLAQAAALRVTITTVLDTVNNALNNLQLFRLRAEETRGLSREELALFDEIVDETSRRLRVLGEMKEFRSRRSGSFEVLDP